MMISYKGVSGKKYVIDKRLGAGGEGEVYSLKSPNDHLVIKVYNSLYELDSEKAKKIQSMISYKGANTFKNYFAWPVDTVNNNGKMSAVIMPKVEGLVLSEFKNNQSVPWSRRIKIAENFCKLVMSAHKEGQVIGDFNGNNFIINIITGSIIMIDVDSLHFTDNKGVLYKCGVVHPEFTPPEIMGLQNIASSDKVFTKESDYFVLAIHIFQLLMYGYHPFSAKVVSSGASLSSTTNTTTNSYIKNAISPYLSKSKGYSVPPYSPDINKVMPNKMIKMFKNTLINGHTNIAKRNKPKEWYNELTKLKKTLIPCKKELIHEYSSNFKDCPWCEQSNRIKIASSPKPMTKTVVEKKPTTQKVNVVKRTSPTPTYSPPPKPANVQINRTTNNTISNASLIKKRHFQEVKDIVVKSLIYWFIGAIIISVISIMMTTGDMGLKNLTVTITKHFVPILLTYLVYDFVNIVLGKKQLKNTVAIYFLFIVYLYYCFYSQNIYYKYMEKLAYSKYTQSILEVEAFWISLIVLINLWTISSAISKILNLIFVNIPPSKNQQMSINALDIITYISIILSSITYGIYYLYVKKIISEKDIINMLPKDGFPSYLQFVKDIFYPTTFTNCSVKNCSILVCSMLFILIILPELRERLNKYIFLILKFAMIFLAYLLLASYFTIFFGVLTAGVEILIVIIILIFLLLVFFN